MPPTGQASVDGISGIDDDVIDVIPAPLPGGLRAQRFRMSIDGGRDSIVRGLQEHGWGSFEPPLPDILSLCVFSGANTVIDVGCNSGFYSLLAVSVTSDACVHAFEPYAPAADLCARNIAMNLTQGRITLNRQAVSRSSGVATLYIPSSNDGGMETSASLNSAFRSSHSETPSVATVSLDAYVEEAHLTSVDAIKIDVESGEHDVLMGAEEVILRDRPIIFCEILASARHADLESLRRHYSLVDVRLRRQTAVVGGAIAFDRDAWNHMLVPDERLERVLDLVGSLELKCSIDADSVPS